MSAHVRWQWRYLCRVLIAKIWLFEEDSAHTRAIASCACFGHAGMVYGFVTILMTL